MKDGWWKGINANDNNTTIRQGDYLSDCSLIKLAPDFDTKYVADKLTYRK